MDGIEPSTARASRVLYPLSYTSSALHSLEHETAWPPAPAGSHEPLRKGCEARAPLFGGETNVQKNCAVQREHAERATIG